MIIFHQVTLFDVMEVVGGVIFCVVVLYIIRLFILVVMTNTKIEKIYRERDRKIESYRKLEGMTIAVAEAQQIHLTEQYEKLIGPLVRKKGYILDILPFLTKK